MTTALKLLNNTRLNAELKLLIGRENLLNVGVGTTSSGGSFVLTAYDGTTILIRDLKGEVLHTINTNQGNNHYAAVSPCGRYDGN